MGARDKFLPEASEGQALYLVAGHETYRVTLDLPGNIGLPSKLSGGHLKGHLEV
jgi:hypothetical protein